MSRQDLLERAIGSLHAAALDDRQWPGASALIEKACGTQGNMAVHCDGRSGRGAGIYFALFCHRGQRREDWERKYFRTYFPRDERVQKLSRLPDGQVTCVDALFTEEEKKVSRVYREVLPRSDTGNGLHVRLDGPFGSNIVWTFADPVDAEGWSSARLDAIERLMPHLRQFVRVKHALEDARSLAATTAELAGSMGKGLIRLSRRGRVLDANDRARSILRDHNVLAVKAGRLRASNIGDNNVLQGMLSRALSRFGGPGERGSMIIRRKGSRSGLVVDVNPLRIAATNGLRSSVGALVLLVDPAHCTAIDADRIGSILELTPAQSEVAVLLAQGNTIRAIASATGRSEGTIRWHVHNIFAKQGISRQADLMELVNSVPASPVAAG